MNPRARAGFQLVEPGLFIGSRLSLLNPQALHQAGITSLLAVNGGKKFPEGFRTMTIDVLDEEDEPINEHFQAAIDFIKESKGPTLVFCDAGRSRSATIVAAFLIQERGLTRTSAINKIKSVRDVRPNRGFWAQLSVFESKAKCDLCVLERRTKWLQETEDFVVLECDQCDCPLVVYRKHVQSAPKEIVSEMQKALEKHANQVFKTEGFHLDFNRRTIPGHFHFHARRGKRQYRL